jgi:hypothetical protein
MQHVEWQGAQRPAEAVTQLPKIIMRAKAIQVVRDAYLVRCTTQIQENVAKDDPVTW